ncbi:MULTISPECIES: hypothetical protein [unclassified Variovorax]|uniref:hypothetical protein n=1 Tax=unclassified Variovorax TaxID=663243 RepID=UPI0013164CCB|nr:MULTISPECIES: hypothetical protein [unclassified Variovorax]VTU42054.1 hypothetical protein SRS16P1_00183 [Variovorax sp. SRS16]VTU42089.1 hypothetical protein E5P1_00181 [Variovorax sp. PBL-E5]VTU44400.1 hypothetical protein H6P1_00750 [Variovorax sp. PBL-H6]
MKPLPPELADLVDGIIKKVRIDVEAGNAPQAFAIVGSTLSREVFEVPLPTDEDQAKTQAAEHIRRVASLMSADFVVLVVNSWGLPKRKLKYFDAIMDKYGSVGNSPYRVSQMAFTVETNEGVWLGTAPLVKNPRKVRGDTFGAVTFFSGTTSDTAGVFSSLLPQVRATRH